MSSTDPDPDSISEFDKATIDTPATPPESTIGDFEVFKDPNAKFNSIPGPDHTFIVRCVADGRYLAVFDGLVSLIDPYIAIPGSTYWACEEYKGWLGLRNVVSGRFLGHDKWGNLICSAERHDKWEMLDIRQRRNGGYGLLMLEKDNLKPIGLKNTVMECLGKIAEDGHGGLTWEFREVGRTDLLKHPSGRMRT